MPAFHASLVTRSAKQVASIAGSTVVIFSTMEILRYGKERLAVWITGKRKGHHTGVPTSDGSGPVRVK